MTIEQWAAIGELLGGLGVLATLVLLALEVRRNTSLLKINTQTSGAEALAGYNERLSADPELLSLFDRMLGGEAMASFSSVERFRMTASMRALLQLLEAQYFQYKGGLIDETYWTARMTWISGMVNIPSLGDWWEVESTSAQLTDEFVAHINSFVPTVAIGPAGQVQDA